MTSDTVEAIAGGGGPAALPRRNGELVFEAPWESRAFGVAVALHDAGKMDFEVFRARLIAEITSHEQSAGAAAPGSGSGYYEHWLDALQDVLLDTGLVSADELDERAASIAHDWAHDHDHHDP
jgi:nitrile hydratase accessory protein